MSFAGVVIFYRYGNEFHSCGNEFHRCGQTGAKHCNNNSSIYSAVSPMALFRSEWRQVRCMLER